MTPDVSRLRARLDYDAEAGKLWWKPAPDLTPTWNARYAGREAFTTISKAGYRVSAIDGDKFYGQHVLWALCHGEWPSGRIRFLDMDRANIRIDNLRLEGDMAAFDRRSLYLRTARAARHAIPPEQEEWLRQHTHVGLRARYALFLEAFPQDRSFWSFKHLCQREGIHYDRDAWNAAVSAAQSLPVGSSRVDPAGYVTIRTEAGWRAEQRVRWEETHGPIPEGKVLMCIDGNRKNTDPANWSLVDKAVVREAALGNTLRLAEVPDSLRPAVIDLARVTVAARKSRRRSSADTPS